MINFLQCIVQVWILLIFWHTGSGLVVTNACISVRPEVIKVLKFGSSSTQNSVIQEIWVLDRAATNQVLY